MKQIPFGKTGLTVPAVAAGCMRISTLSKEKIREFIHTALDLGAIFFDHADIYGNGACETAFAEAIGMCPSVREKIILQSKCGIVPGVMYDFSKEHILQSVDNSLRRLQTEYLDILLLHRPDALAEPEEIAEAFDSLEKSGKVRYFGVSNQNPMQIRLLKKYVKQDICANQLQLSVPHAQMIRSGLEVNMHTEGSIDRDGSVLDYCRLEDITIQAWSPFQYGFLEGVFLNSEKYPDLNRTIDELAEKYGCSNTTIAAAWILRHPAKMQLVSGTTNPTRLKDICRAGEIHLTKEEWYKVYMSAGNRLP